MKICRAFFFAEHHSDFHLFLMNKTLDNPANLNIIRTKQELTA